MLIKRLEKDFEEFLDMIVKLEPNEWLGVARILDVKVELLRETDNKIEPRSAEDIFEEMLDKFLALNKKRRKTLLNLMRDATK